MFYSSKKFYGPNSWMAFLKKKPPWPHLSANPRTSVSTDIFEVKPKFGDLHLSSESFDVLKKVLTSRHCRQEDPDSDPIRSTDRNKVSWKHILKGFIHVPYLWALMTSLPHLRNTSEVASSLYSLLWKKFSSIQGADDKLGHTLRKHLKQ